MLHPVDLSPIDSSPSNLDRSMPVDSRQPWVKAIYQFLFLLLVTFIFTACEDSTLSADEPDATVEKETPINVDPDCPPQFVRQPTPNNPATCYINPDDVGEVPEEPNMEDLVNVDDSILDEQYQSYLTQEGDGKFFVYVNESKKIGVRAVNNIGAPVPGMTVTFEILMSGDGFISDPKGSTLSAMRAVSDQFGVAAVDLQAGAEPTYFKVKMIGPEGTTDLTYQVNVIQKNIADNEDLTTLPPQQRCFGTQGNYDIKNNYNIAQSLFGSGVANVFSTITNIISNPADAIADWVRDLIGGFVGDLVRGIVREAVDWVLSYFDIPVWVNEMLNVISDIGRILTRLEIQGLIRIGIPDGENMCISQGYHKWEKLTFFWGLNCDFNDPNCGRHELALSELGVSLSESEFLAKPGMPTRNFVPVEFTEHDMNLNVGVLAITIIQNFVLPDRLNVHSLGEAIAMVFPCDFFGELAYNLVGDIPFVGGAVAGLAEDACRSGIEALGNELTRQLIEKLSVSVFRIKGNSNFKDVSGADRLTDEIKDGVWTGALEGTFEGRRIAAPAPNPNPNPNP